MDYSKLFEEKYQDTFLNLENFVNSEFKSSKEDDDDERDYLETYNEVRSKLEEWRNQHFENSSLKPDVEIYNYFTSRNNKVSFPEYLFPGVLERKTKKLFLEKHPEAEYTAFIEELAENKGYKDFIDITNNYDKYIELVYKDKKWKPIEFDKFDHNYESAEYFLKLHRKIYPPPKPTGSKTKKDYSKEITETKQRLESFTDEEKIFLLRVFHENIVKSNKGIDKTEFMRFSHITSGIKDQSIFYKTADRVESYTIMKKDFDYFSKLDEGRFFQHLINRLEKLGMPVMKAEIKMIQSKT